MNAVRMKIVVLTAVALVLLVAAGAVGYFVAMRSVPAPAAKARPAHHKVLYWYDPMTPQQHFEHPGLSPMGMQMVPKYASQNGSTQDIVRINPAELQNLGLRSAQVKIGRLSDTLHVPGTVAWDQRLAVTVSARTNLTIVKLYVRAPFTAVKVGQPLAEILAPRWSAAAAQYFALRDAKSSTGRALRAAARARLHALGMTDASIADLRAGHGTITLRAPIDGVVSRLAVQQGEQLGQGMPIMRINGLDKVWVEAAIPQAKSAGLHAGTPVVATVSALPGKTFRGTVAKLLPVVDATTRTQRARIVLANPKHDLAPGMFANLRLTPAPGAPHPLVPTQAVIADGHQTRVIEVLGNGQFKPVRVRTGRSVDGMTAIVAGLHGGERIVTSAQFLIDSEASLAGALQRLKGNTISGGAGAVEPVSRRETGGSDGSAQQPGSGSPEPSSGPADHLLPAGEGQQPASMVGMKMPMPAASASSNGVRQP